MRKLAIIPARGGSKRIPQKNIKLFLDKPIIAYSIEIAIESGLFEEVMVSTDDSEIAKIAEKFGAKVPFLRSAKNADDFATTADVLLEVLDYYKGRYDFACCIYPTAPFITKEVLKESFSILKKGNYDSVFPVVKYSYPIQRSLYTENGNIKMVWPNYLNSRSQDLEARYHDAGQFYSFKVNAFINNKKMFTDNSGYIEVNELSVQDIDSETDWKIAELKYKICNNL